MKKFEYKIIAGSEMLNIKRDEALLNELGQDGWELVAMESMKLRGDGIGTKRQVYWLKREKNKEDVRDELPIFEVGIPNLAKDDNTIKVRKFIDYEFGLDFDKTPLQCTEYVQYKVLKELGIKIDWTGRVGPRDGAVWPEQLLKLERYKVLDMPKKGCAMSFAAGCPVPPGHVAYIEDVSMEDGSILISEANWPPHGQKVQGHYNERPLTKKDWQNKYKGKFIDFS